MRFPLSCGIMAHRSVITIGNFDGVHLGHRAILARAQKSAQQHDAFVLALTFDPLPIAVLRPGSQPLQLLSLTDRVARLRQAGAAEVQVIEPTAELLDQSPTAFIASLMDRYHPVAMVEGENFCFGKDRAGDDKVLAELGEAFGFEISIVPTVRQCLSDQLVAPVSSSLVRHLLKDGRVADVTRCLNRPFELESQVVQGEQRGRALGIPTANLDMSVLTATGRATPGEGVYAGQASLEDGRVFNAAISVGTKPTFDVHGLVVEAHLLDFCEDLYGQVLKLSFTRWIREQRPFPCIEDLRFQLGCDIKQVHLQSQ